MLLVIIQSNPKNRVTWTAHEERAITELYNKLLAFQQRGMLGTKKTQITKKTLISTFINERVPARSRGSVEANCRKVLGQPLVKGFQPLPKCSKSLLKLHGIED